MVPPTVYAFPNNSFLFLTEVGGAEGGSVRSDSPGPALQSPPQVDAEQPPDPELEKRLLGYLSELSLSLPIDSLTITNQLNTVSAVNVLVYTTGQKSGHTYCHYLSVKYMDNEKDKLSHTLYCEYSRNTHICVFVFICFFFLTRRHLLSLSLQSPMPASKVSSSNFLLKS